MNTTNFIKEQILSKVPEEVICQHYMRRFYPNSIVVPNEKIAPPYDKRTDKEFHIYVRSNRVWWYDTGTKQRGDIFQLLRKIGRLNYWEVLTMLDMDFALGLIKNNQRLEKDLMEKLNNNAPFWVNGKRADSFFTFEKKLNRVFKKENFDWIDSKGDRLYKFFNSKGINKELVDAFEVRELDHYEITVSPLDFFVRRTMENPLFAYSVSKQVKMIYPILKGNFKPFAYGGKIGAKFIFGLKQLKDRKSIVDNLFLANDEINTMILTANGFDAVCIGGGDELMTKELYEKLSFAKKIIFLHEGSKTENAVVSFLKKEFNIPSINYNNLINNARN